MILNHLGLSADEHRDVHRAVASSYRGRTRVELLALDGEHLDDISEFLADGQVDGDLSQAVSRTASLTFTDPRQKLPFDTDSPARVALGLDRMVRVLWGIFIPSWGTGGDWVDIPMFTGRLSTMQRTGDQVVTTWRDRATFGMASCWAPLHIDKGKRKTDAITTILMERAGAHPHELDIPDHPARLPRGLSLHSRAHPWLRARRVAHSMDRQLYYDGAGICRLRHHPTQSRFSFTGDGHVTTPIQVAYTDDVVNAVRVFGAQPKGPKSQVVAEAVAPANHKFSPDKMGRNGIPLYLAKFIDDSSLKHHVEAQARADRELADGLTQSVDVTFSCVPVPFLDLGDMCHVDTDDGDVTFRLKTFSLPLLVGQGDVGTEMTIGVRKRLQHHHARHQGHRHQHRRRVAREREHHG